MTEPDPVPVNALHKILVHLEHERMLLEEAKDDKRHDHVYPAVAEVRKWLSSVDRRAAGLKIVIEPKT
jgi:hypothetical protein